MNTLSTSLAVFSRAPVPGVTKTRLIPLLGAEGAARAHAQLLDVALRCATQAFPGKVEVCAAGDAGHPELAAVSAHWGVPIHLQRGVDLGDRMHHALTGMLGRDERALIIGSDCAVLSTDVLLQASAALVDHDMVFVPAEDGGYVLVGARAGTALDRAFKGISWSTAAVMEQTRKALNAAGVSFAELAPLWDIDEPADWLRAVAAGLVLPATGGWSSPPDADPSNRSFK